MSASPTNFSVAQFSHFCHSFWPQWGLVRLRNSVSIVMTMLSVLRVTLQVFFLSDNKLTVAVISLFSTTGFTSVASPPSKKKMFFFSSRQSTGKRDLFIPSLDFVSQNLIFCDVTLNIYFLYLFLFVCLQFLGDWIFCMP